MKRYKPYIIGAIGGVVGAALVPLTGLISFDASRGHWEVTDWYFHIAARQSTTLRSAGTAVPPLDDPAMVRRGAGHYEMVCAACHGSPAGPPERFAEDLTPMPPRLVEQMGNWRPDGRVFWNVKHGIKRSGMPAWPSAVRDDEVWDMVAFLKEMPTLDAVEYRALAGEAPCACRTCHGEDGSGAGPGPPRLDIQSPEYLAAALVAFREGARQSGTMMAAASGMTDAQIDEFSAYFGQVVRIEAQAGGPGAEIARRGIPERNIGACDSCHGTEANPAFPRLMGQDRDYLETQLRLFMELGGRRGGPFADIMARAINVLDNHEYPPLTEAEIEAIVDHYGR